MAALRAAEQMRTTTLIGKMFDVPVGMLAGRAVDDLWVSPMTLEHTEEHWPSHDHEPRHPRRRAHGLTARQYRAACRAWRREHRAWRRRQPAPPFVMVVIRAEARALTRDGTVQKFAHVQAVTKRLALEEPAILERTIKHMAHEMRAALVRHWEEA